MTIGQLAKITDLTVETIRYYERLKLISRPQSKNSTYRMYTNEYVHRINYIKKAKELGFKLKEIKDILSFEECKDLYDLTNYKLDEILEVIKKFNNLARRLKSLLKTCPKSGTINNCSIMRSISKY